MKPYIVLVLFSFLFSAHLFSQVHFPFGTYVWRDKVGDTTVKQLGINTLVTRASDSSKTYMEQFDKSIAANGDEQNDYIHNYTLGYYKIWQAEENRTDINAGIKHSIGDSATIDGTSC